MSTEAILEHCRTLSYEEKLALISALWNEMEAEEDARPLTENERWFLEERTRDIGRDPRPDRSWDEVRGELLART